ncbi:hypothetical protein [Parapedobacter lycopersici]|uniref:hypothetical protein n=1 Tax=Parapedobacter lycopersici TaxID=1864939 RepID=UPI00214D81DF|nr:hypothetical protein [Parapedobacter lycopersici]
MELNRRDFIELLNDIESTIPVYDWKFGEIDIWPLVKRDLFFYYYKKSDTKQDPQSAGRKSFGFNVFALIRSLFRIFRLKCQSQNLSITKMYCGYSAHRVNWEGRFINRYFHPIINNGNDDVLELEYGIRDQTKIYPDQHRLLFFEDYRLGFLLLNKFRKKKILYQPGWSDFKKKLAISTNIDTEKFNLYVSKRIRELAAMTGFFSLLISKYNFKEIFGLCYYNNAMFALHFASNKVNIVNYDVQHGGQGSLHPMYTYCNYPPNGLNVLPRIFWCWDAGSRHNIEKWLDAENGQSAILGGNPWVQFQLSQKVEFQFPKKRIILYTLQQDELDDFILETIVNTPIEFQWWIRLHPRMPSSRSRVTEQLQNIGKIEEVEIDAASRLPLPLILKNTSVHISKFSGSIIEGILLEVPTIIIDETGTEIYSHYLDLDFLHVHIEKEEDTLLRLITTIFREGRVEA